MYPMKHQTYQDCDYRIGLTNLFRKLWEQHVTWTRSFIISTAADLGDLQPVTQRLLRNPGDFANALQQYYGAQNAERISQLLTEHLTIAAQLVNAAKQGDAGGVETYRDQWYENADEIAAFLAAINPYWNEEMWRNMLYDHLQMTEDEAVDRLNGQYASDIALYDEIEEQGLNMADAMTEGIIRQFGL